MIRRLLALCVAVLLAGCASNRHIQSQALDFADADLNAVKQRLVLLTIHIEPASMNLKLRGFDVRNPSSGEVFSFAFFNNVILGSKALAHIVGDNAVQHMVFLDLPAGSYVMDDFEFAFLSQESASTTALRKKLTTPVLIEVSGDRAVYLGRLAVRLANLRATGAFGQQIKPGDDRTIRIGPLDTADLDLTATITQPADEDLLKAKTRYKALADQPFARGTMALRR
ncbi:MAG: hypothetical protein HS128_07175 [Ideonella sp.]|nr:hypothetical protein [Ideonella sp.]MCC7456803.1 hypothetical protein [Nitrospira sp.]